MARLRSQSDILSPINSGSIIAATTAPTAPRVGTRWFNTATAVTYQYTQDAAGTKFWLDISSGGIGAAASRGVDFVGDTDPHLETSTTGAGLAIGSVYYNREADRYFVCTTTTTNANVWAGRFAGSGGVETTYKSGSDFYRVHTFLGSGTFLLDSTTSVNWFVVAGGGGGGWGTGGRGGGGGAGGLRFKTSTVSSGTYPIVVGAGGVEALTSSAQGSDGGTSSASGFSSTGGGGGASASSQNGRAGGSGGGAGINTSVVGAGNAGSHTPVEGFAGGLGSSSFAGGGGGGSAAVGTAGTSNNTGGNGGAGSSTFITDAATTAAFLYAAKAGTNAANAATSGLGSNPGTLYIAAGGGGSTDNATNSGGLGGAGGGGRSVGLATNNIQPVVNTGSGGYAQRSGAGNGNGSSGIVIVRYQLNA